MYKAIKNTAIIVKQGGDFKKRIRKCWPDTLILGLEQLIKLYRDT